MEKQSQSIIMPERFYDQIVDTLVNIVCVNLLEVFH